MADSTDDARWVTSHQLHPAAAADVRNAETSQAMFAEAEKKYSARLRRAKLARQVTIFGWGGVDDTVTKVRLMCRIPEVDRAAVTALFDDVRVEFYARLPNGTIREVSGWDAQSDSWMPLPSPYEQSDRMRALEDHPRTAAEPPKPDPR